MSNSGATEQSNAQELFFLYELAKVFGSSLELEEVAEFILDGACALIGAEQGFLCTLETIPAALEISFPEDERKGPAYQLHPYTLRGISQQTWQDLAHRLLPVWAERQSIYLRQPGGETWVDLLATPLIVRDQVRGILGISTATARPFTPRERERLVSVAALGALAFENARLHERIQREAQALRGLIQAARQMGEGQLSGQQIASLENSTGWDDISHLSIAFAHMARQVIEREETLHQKVRELEIVIDDARRDKEIAEITESEYFQRIQEKVRELRRRNQR